MTVYCQLCGQKIVGRSRTFNHALWPPGTTLQVCAACAQSKPRCRECSLPLSAETHNGLCVTCSQSLRCCLACSQLVKGKYYEFDGLGPYCQSCYQQRPPCDVCGAPLTDEHWQLSDGRVVCASCHATAIYAPGQAAALYDEMKALAAGRLGLRLNIPTGLALVDRSQLRQVIHRQTAPDSTGPTASTLDDFTSTLEDEVQRTLGLYARRGMRRGIYIQTGLPRLLFLQVAAHEYAHAWQGENCPILHAGLAYEGFAEWAAYQVLDFYGYRRGQQRMLARQDLYGQGLRWALDEEARHGVQGLLAACREQA